MMPKVSGPGENNIEEGGEGLQSTPTTPTSSSSSSSSSSSPPTAAELSSETPPKRTKSLSKIYATYNFVTLKPESFEIVVKQE